MGTVEDNAAHIKNSILKVMEETGAEKVNILAHSKGGLDSRYMISHLGMGDQIASLTTFSTPHHGSMTVDFLLHIPAPLVRATGFLFDVAFRLAGDKHPKSYEAIQIFRTDRADAFNRATPDDARVYYQSYGFCMKHWYSDILMLAPHLVVRAIEGENDGLLPPRAVKWTNFRGVYRGNGFRGISHCDEIDMRRCRLSKKTGDGISDMVDFYTDVVHRLREDGF